MGTAHFDISTTHNMTHSCKKSSVFRGIFIRNPPLGSRLSLNLDNQKNWWYFSEELKKK